MPSRFAVQIGDFVEVADATVEHGADVPFEIRAGDEDVLVHGPVMIAGKRQAVARVVIMASSRSFPIVKGSAFTFFGGSFQAGSDRLFRSEDRSILRDAESANRFERETDTGFEGLGDAAEHAQRVTFVIRGFQPADLLLGSADSLGEFALAEAGLFAGGGNLQGDVPSFARAGKAVGELGVAELFVEVGVEVGFHGLFLASQPARRWRAVLRS